MSESPSESESSVSWQRPRSPSPPSSVHSSESSGCTVSPLTPPTSARRQRGTSGAGRPEREVYVGNLPVDAGPDDVRQSFEELMCELPGYKERYRDLPSPVTGMQHPNGQGQRTSFLFVEFADAVLASTAVAMSGLWVRARLPASLWPRAGGGGPGAGRGPAAQAAAAPVDRGPGRQDALRRVGRLPPGGGARAAARSLAQALLALPSVRERFPDLLDPVTCVEPREGYAFAELANEVLASTAVAMGNFPLPGGCAKTGWPCSRPDAARRAPPPLAAPRLADDEWQSSPHDPTEALCEIFLGGTRGLDASELWAALAGLLRSLPGYRAAYPQDGNPVVGVRTGRGSFAFARLSDPKLASTAVALGEVRVRGRRLQISRPSHYVPPVSGPPPPLDLVSTRAPMLWVGNLAPTGHAGVSEARRLLDEHLTRLAVQCPDFDVEAGPPVKRISVHQSGRFAFVELRESALAERLLEVYDGSEH
eukprot:CAMPEP_0168469138 /NCGR_PEP_ID=MMETSP0228-20121227/58061_1 /TAXON_ID=133427 /ORGANISM="Protoceratium reticulatum, Strain CCCM 535 (=CCMP 1889)" /LENGTH=478 /DNA_ID=CAMNT_0008484905 /DNA_START=24 /DNA_END=1458 /DNA_ORIENTATION=-